MTRQNECYLETPCNFEMTNSNWTERNEQVTNNVHCIDDLKAVEVVVKVVEGNDV